jgi:hypothetical protein
VAGRWSISPKWRWSMSPKWVSRQTYWVRGRLYKTLNDFFNHYFVVKYSQIGASYWMTFPLTIVNFNHFFIQPTPEIYFTLILTSITTLTQLCAKHNIIACARQLRRVGILCNVLTTKLNWAFWGKHLTDNYVQTFTEHPTYCAQNMNEDITSLREMSWCLYV